MGRHPIRYTQAHLQTAKVPYDSLGTVPVCDLREDVVGVLWSASEQAQQAGLLAVEVHGYYWRRACSV